MLCVILKQNPVHIRIKHPRNMLKRHEKPASVHFQFSKKIGDFHIFGLIRVDGARGINYFLT